MRSRASNTTSSSTHAPRLCIRSRNRTTAQETNDQTLLQALSSDSRGFRRVWVMVRREGPARDNLQDDSPAVAAKLQSVFGSPAIWQFKDITVLEFGR